MNSSSRDGTEFAAKEDAMPIKPNPRYPYSPITERADFAWPEGKRLAVYLALNIEVFSFGDGLGAEIAPGGPQPDVLNYAWRDYGNRVGAWRLIELFQELGLPCAALLNSDAIEHCPQLVRAFVQRGDEIVGHGRTNAERQSSFSLDEERWLIDEATSRIRDGLGVTPRGWLGPWISQSHATPELLKAAGYGYLLDWCHDDQPSWMATANGPILSVPYPQELNDIPAIAVRRMGASEFADVIVDNFDEMLGQSARQPLVMGIALHGYILGQPFRLRQLRRALRHILAHRDAVWVTTPGAVAEAYTALHPAPG